MNDEIAISIAKASGNHAVFPEIQFLSDGLAGLFVSFLLLDEDVERFGNGIKAKAVIEAMLAVDVANWERRREPELHGTRFYGCIDLVKIAETVRIG